MKKRQSKPSSAGTTFSQRQNTLAFAVNGWLKRSGVKFQIRNNKIYQNLPGRGKRGVKRRARQPSGHKDHKGFGLNFTFQYQNGRILTTIVTTHYMVTYSVTTGNHYSP